jgi:D-tyrosyl-tRNA(Tyr) deacylase
MLYLMGVRAVVQRVTEASVTVGDETVGEIGPGLAVLLGVKHSDGPGDAGYLAEKTAHLRVFDDDQGRMNRSLLETGGSALVVSQFTLLGDVRRGRRPNYSEAAPPEIAEDLYLQYCRFLRDQGIAVATGRFGAEMVVRTVGDGPVTILLDSERLF